MLISLQASEEKLLAGYWTAIVTFVGSVVRPPICNWIGTALPFGAPDGIWRRAQLNIETSRKPLGSFRDSKLAWPGPNLLRKLRVQFHSQSCTRFDGDQSLAGGGSEAGPDSV